VLVAFDLPDAEDRLELAVSGTALSLSAKSTTGGSSSSVSRGTSVDLATGAWTSIRIEPTSLAAASAAIWIGRTARTEKIGIPAVGRVSGFAVGVASAAAAELFVDDILVTEP
jgi:hypothetical protein